MNHFIVFDKITGVITMHYETASENEPSIPRLEANSLFVKLDNSDVPKGQLTGIKSVDIQKLKMGQIKIIDNENTVRAIDLTKPQGKSLLKKSL